MSKKHRMVVTFLAQDPQESVGNYQVRLQNYLDGVTGNATVVGPPFCFPTVRTDGRICTLIQYQQETGDDSRVRKMELAIERMLSISNLWLHSGDIPPEHAGEAEVLQRAFNELKESLEW